VAVTNGYVSLALVKKALRITDDIDDEILELSIEAASREIDGYCERVFYATTETRVFIPRDSFTCEIDDLTSLTTLKTSSTGESFDVTWTSTDYQLEPLNGRAGGLVTPSTRIRAVGDYVFPTFEPRNVNHYEATVQVAGTFGFTPIPTAVEQAALLLTLRQYRRYDSPLGVAGFDEMGVVRVGRIDPDVQKLLSPFRRVKMA
jgi:hypothetical protein